MTTTKTQYSGQLPFRMTNDLIFKYLLQQNEFVLKALIAAFLEIPLTSIRNIKITNPISLSDDLYEKEMILDVRVELNDDAIINLEMQVLNTHEWPERSLSYLCKCFDNLKKGQPYSMVKSAYHLGFLDYTLFPEDPHFYSQYMLSNPDSGKIYSSKFKLCVVDLTLREAATRIDKKFHRDLWASFFKSTNWEDLYMLASKDKSIESAVKTVEELAKEERIKDMARAHEDWILQQMDFHGYYIDQLKNRDHIIYEKEKEVDSLNRQLTYQQNELLSANSKITAQSEEIDELKAQLRNLKNDLVDIKNRQYFD